MVGILIIAHGTLGESFIHCASHVMGHRPENLVQLGITIYDDPKTILPQAQRILKCVDQGHGVLIFTDIYGATPANIATKLIVPGQVECIAGVNLPMLIKALNYRQQPLNVVIQKAMEGANCGVKLVTPPQVESENPTCLISHNPVAKQHQPNANKQSVVLCNNNSSKFLIN